MGSSHIFIWGSAADHNMMLCWPLSYVRALYVVNTFLCFCSIAAGTSSNIFANMVRTFRQVVVVVQLCEDDWCAWWPPGGSASSQSWGERGGCWGDLVQVIRIINILPHPCLRGSCSEGVLKMAPNVQTSKCWLQCTGSGTCDKETERDTQGDVANQLRSILLSARYLD